MLPTISLETRAIAHHTRVTGGNPNLGQEAEAGAGDRFRPETLLGFP